VDNHRAETLWEVTNVPVHPDSNLREEIAKTQTNVAVHHVRMVAPITVEVSLASVLQDSTLSQEAIVLPLMVSIASVATRPTSHKKGYHSNHWMDQYLVLETVVEALRPVKHSNHRLTPTANHR
jgi:hypothetical protein